MDQISPWLGMKKQYVENRCFFYKKICADIFNQFVTNLGK